LINRLIEFSIVRGYVDMWHII